MKKYLLPYILVFSMLVGCSTPSNSIYQNNAASNHIAIKNDIKMITDVDGILTETGTQTDKGYYELMKFSDNGTNILFTDFKSKTRIFLCNQANCLHQDNTCTSWIESNNGGGEMLFADSGNLYCLSLSGTDSENDNNKNCMRIYQIDENGSNKKELYVFKATDDLHGGIATDGENLYFILKQMTTDWKGFTKNLVALNTKTRELTILSKCENDDFIFGANEKNLYIKSIDRANSSDKTGNAGWEENFANTSHTIFTLSMETLDKKASYSWKQTEKYGLLFKNDFVYIDYIKSKIIKTNLDNKEDTEIASLSFLVPMENTNLHGVFDNRFCFELVDNSDVNNIKWLRFMADIVNGGVAENQMKYNFSNDTKPVRIVAETNNEFLVISQLKETSVTRYKEDGIAETTNIIAPVYSVIDKANYWAGKEIYTAITDLVLFNK